MHRFSIRNSSKLAISHLFSRFHTFFSHLFQLFFYSLRTPHSYPPVKKRIVLIATSVLKFCLGTNFVTPYTIHTPYIHHTYTIHTDIWITIPRVGLKALELIRNSIFWSILNFGTSAGTLSSTVFNEEYDGLIKFSVYSIIT